MLRNNVTLCDLYDNELEVCSKEIAHKQGLLHRAFSVFLINGDKMMIQKRADTKYHTPSLWTNACCSHPRLNENVVLSAELRCKEELGIDVKLREISHFVYYYKFKPDLVEYEFDHIMLGNYDGEFDLDPEEASDYKWIDIDELALKVQNEPQLFTPWFIICLPMVIDYLKQNK